MLSRLAADLTLIAHLGFILFVVGGGALAWRWRWMPVLHLPAVAWGMFIELTGGICPLTHLENALRLRAGIQGYAGGFVEHYLLPLIYPAGLSPRTQLLLAAGLGLINLAIYGALLWRRRWRHRAVTGPTDAGSR